MEINGKGLAFLTKKDNSIYVKLLNRIDPILDKEILEKLSILKKTSINNLIPNGFKFYIPFEFKMETETEINNHSIKIVYPKKAKFLKNKNNLKIFVFEDKYKISDKEIVDIDNVLYKKLTEYIKKQTTGMVGIQILEKDDYQKYLKKERDRLLPNNNRVYYCITKDNERFLRIVFTFSNDGIYGKNVILYNIKNGSVDNFYSTTTQ